MGNGFFLKKPVIKLAAITFLAAVLISSFIFYFYDLKCHKLDAGQLVIEEDKIPSRDRSIKGQFRFCSYPDTPAGPQIGLGENADRAGRKSLRMVFKGGSGHSLGIELYLTLNLRPFLEKGELTFKLKGGRGCSLIRELSLYLKDNQLINRTVRVSSAVKIGKHWQKISLPLSMFTLPGENKGCPENIDKDFTWEIKELLFSTNSFSYGEDAELFIKDLRVIRDDETVYDLSQIF